MRSLLAKLTLNQRLGGAAIVLGLLALAAGGPGNGQRVTIDPQELALIVEKELDHVSVEELADWIIQGRMDYRLLDLRDGKEFAEYAIPSSEHVPLAALESYPLLRNEKIVLYSGGGIHSAQAWFLLKARGYKGVYMLTGGMEEWKDRILFPRIPENPSNDRQASFEKMKYVSQFFGGSPQSGIGEAAAPVRRPIPKLETKSQQIPTGKGKKKKEGC